MAKHNALVCDTHPLVFHAAGGRRLGVRGAAHFDACERREAILYIPVAAIWECCCLVHVGKIDLKRPPKKFFEDLFRNPAYQPLDLTPVQAFLAHEFRPNKDPFDALICGAVPLGGSRGYDRLFSNSPNAQKQCFRLSSNSPNGQKQCFRLSSNSPNSQKQCFRLSSNSPNAQKQRFEASQDFPNA